MAICRYRSVLGCSPVTLGAPRETYVQTVGRRLISRTFEQWHNLGDSMIQWHHVIEAGTLLASAGTAVAVFLAYRQLVQTRDQSVTAFEDRLSEQYREIVRSLPVEMMLAGTLHQSQLDGALPVFYQYFDLSNEQAFLHSRGRVSDVTWADWEEGMRQNAELAAFKAAWQEIRCRRPGVFDDLAEIFGEPECIERLDTM